MATDGACAGSIESRKSSRTIRPAQAQRITLPCDIAGSFFPAADVDTFEFNAKKGEVWWVEVASERLGLPTDPSIIVQHVAGTGGDEKLTDVAELSDIPSPVKVSSNGYAYDGPPYNAGSTDILGKIEIKEDGLHRLKLSDLFGGTRNDPRNVYRLIIRQAAPDFALVAWALHMELRNGDRNALSKPISLRGGSTMALEVVAVRRDGFDGEIELTMENLPDGVTASGLKIPAGQSRGIMLVTAAEGAPQGVVQRQVLRSSRDRWRNGHSPLPFGFHGMASHRCVERDSEPAFAGRCVGLGRWVRNGADHDCRARRQGMGGDGGREVDDSVDSHPAM